MDGLEVPEQEIAFISSRSGGPGGQNVNKVSTRVTLLFDVDRSSALTAEQRERIRSRLSSRINQKGVLRVISQRTRSQELNRADALNRFVTLLREALIVEKSRLQTRAHRIAKEQRLEGKRKRAQLKQARSKTRMDES